MHFIRSSVMELRHLFLLVMPLIGTLAVAQPSAEAPRGAGHARHAPEEMQRHRQELRELIRQQQGVNRSEVVLLPAGGTARQLSPQEREVLRDQLRQQRRAQ